MLSVVNRKDREPPTHRWAAFPKFISRSLFPHRNNATNSLITKPTHVNLGNQDTTLIIAPNFPVTLRLNTEGGRKWL